MRPASGQDPLELSPFRRIAGTALPLYVTMIAASIGAALNVGLVGRHATASLAAFAVTIAVYSPATATVAGVLRGVAPFVAQAKRDREHLGALIHTGMWLGMSVGILGAAAVACVGPVGRLVGVSAETVHHLGAFPYFLAVAVVSASMGTSATSILVALGRSRIVLRAGIVGTAVTVLASILLVDGPGPLPSLGLTGAGIAIVGGSLVGTTRAQVALHRLPELDGLALLPGRPDVAEMARLARVGIPLAGTVLIKFVVLGVLTFAAARLGTEQAAAHGVSETLVNLIYTAAVAVGQSTVPVVAGAIRDGDVAGSRRSVYAGARVALCAVGLLGCALVAFGHWIIPLFTTDPTVEPLLHHQLPLVLLVVVTDALQAVFGFGMVGLKRTVPSLVSTAVFFGGLCVLSVPIANAYGLTGLWLALFVANCLQAASKLGFFYLHSGRLIARAVA